mmetsp:Transcript_20940/g.45249  ORF Transcript_20940/g.45249 Transcript_20940/m.45249 type:complete len:80 (-) Transcript_20940:121-360(-)
MTLRDPVRMCKAAIAVPSSDSRKKNPGRLINSSRKWSTTSGTGKAIVETMQPMMPGGYASMGGTDRGSTQKAVLCSSSI